MSANCFNLVSVPVRAENFKKWRDYAIQECSRMPDYDISVARLFLEGIDDNNIMGGASGDVLCWFNDGKHLINLGMSSEFDIWFKLIRLSYPTDYRNTRSALLFYSSRWLIQTQYENNSHIDMANFYYNECIDSLCFRYNSADLFSWLDYDQR